MTRPWHGYDPELAPSPWRPLWQLDLARRDATDGDHAITREHYYRNEQRRKDQQVTDQIDAMDLCKKELAEAMFPDPDEFLNDVGPLTQVFYLNQLAYGVMKNYTAMLANAPGEQPPEGSEPVVALQMLTEACGMLDQACVTLSILPTEAVG